MGTVICRDREPVRSLACERLPPAPPTPSRPAPSHSPFVLPCIRGRAGEPELALPAANLCRTDGPTDRRTAVYIPSEKTGPRGYTRTCVSTYELPMLNGIAHEVCRTREIGWTSVTQRVLAPSVKKFWQLLILRTVGNPVFLFYFLVPGNKTSYLKKKLSLMKN